MILSFFFLFNDFFPFFPCPSFRKAGRNVNINGKECLNFASLDFLSMLGKPEIEVSYLVSADGVRWARCEGKPEIEVSLSGWCKMGQM